MTPMNDIDLYPLKFVPAYKTRIWGGSQLATVLKREVPHSDEPVGEAWELSDRDDVNSVVAEGPLAGKTIRELVASYGSALLGSRCRDLSRFPLLVKLIDAGERLSLQVHPDAAACARLGRGAEPKTEMWYVIAAERGAKIFAGLRPRATRLQLAEYLSGGAAELESQLQVYESLPGDAYYIPSGTVHAIGAGNLLLEIQQNSDTTYRLSDWGRKDAQGNSRELHIEQGMAAIDFTNRVSPRIAGVVNTANHNRKFDVIRLCPHFRVSDLRLVTRWNDTTANDGSFHLLCAVNAPVEVAAKTGAPVRLEAGESVLLPACSGAYTVDPLAEGECTVVKTML